MRKLTLLLLLLVAVPCYAGSLTQDEFSGSSLGGHWATSGPGTVAVSDGYLTISGSTTTYTYASQTGITGAFDIVARIEESIYYPEDIDSAFFQCALFILDEVDGTQYASVYQNAKTGDPDNNEAYMYNAIGDFPYGSNPTIAPMEFICARIVRDESNDFYMYYNSASDCSGDWTEANPGTRLNSSNPVTISLRARFGSADTFRVDYIRDLLQPEASTATLQGISASGASFN